MLVSQLAPAKGFPYVQSFVASLIDMQFSDVRAMLQLPRPDIGITPGCNFAIISSLCNLISGISTTIHKPADLPDEPGGLRYRSARAFCELVRDFFPYMPPGIDDFPNRLYHLCRNPLAHSVGLTNAASPVVFFTRIFDPAHPGIGWSDQELEDIERPDRPFTFPHPGIVIGPEQWTVHCDSLYIDVICMLRRLNADPVQMQAAETRFSQGVYNWRR